MSVPPRAVRLDEATDFLREHPEVQFVDLLIADMNGVVRGKRIERNNLPKVFEKGINLPASLFALDITGSTVESTGLGLDIGDADRVCFPITDTLSMEPWQKRPTAQLLMTMHEMEGEPFFADPREVLRQVVQRFDELGLTVCAAFELEFYLIDQENINGRPQPPRSPISGKRPQSVQVYSMDDLDEYADCLQDIIDGARAQGIPADAIVAESAPAQFEVNLNHVADPIKACDYAVLLKRLIKNVAYDHEMDTTFMAKPYPGQAGNGLHVHISLLDKEGRNIFAGEDPEQNAALRHAIGGVLETLPACMAFLCPNVNSYRRFGSQFFVPNAPSWGLDNRTTALRVPTGTPEAHRIEHRVAGADANPYLLLAGVLAGVHHGLTRQIEPGPVTEGNSYEQHEQSLPNNLRDALRYLDDSSVMAEYIDPKYIDIFVACKEHELEEFEHSISDLEYNWYLHTV
ncbi:MULTISPECIES: glutamine synthetase family protein [Pseudomonadaceae]|jgi:glutamine synthetase|uniref:Gamma-glutamylputrescine synthetase n=3 Tax=Pseudomonadaceae TaxID=135621 RepID=A0A0U4P4Z4_9PSED|nr:MULTISPECIES: glutamine synthetase family protein [Pseudomonas]HCV75231.1 glutamine synthetase [Pseudomonas sp.]ALZ86017.1 gamma-glutamylputrescine synthetase [Pseudomonas oryzihabitans]EHK70726.1 putative glutamine synthetase [Pseudomonas psychrotolerans L19]KTT55420.1 gamma-glutamylputrescine synthetase [Pseudomonas psychrotolerans]KXJ32859.1 gamma-glutamylputrescine synthetase [Pseudomonas sp. HUK17]